MKRSATTGQLAYRNPRTGVSAVVANDRKPFNKGDSIFRSHVAPDGHRVMVLNRTVYEGAVEKARASLRKAATLK